MSPTYDEKLEQFRRREIERARRAGISAYILNEDGSVIRVFPDGRLDLIVVQLGGERAQLPGSQSS